MRDTWYPAEVNGDYFFFRFDEEVTLGKLRIADLIADLQNRHRKDYGSYKTGEPLFVTAHELLKYRISL